MTLLIPAARARATGLRRLVPPEALDRVIATLQGHPQVNRSVWAKQAQQYTAKINSGDVVSLSEVIRDLQLPADGGSFSKRGLFELAMERLAGEFAAVSGTSKAAAVVRLTQTLQEARDVAGQAERLAEGT